VVAMWMLYWAVANKKIAERILRERGNSLTKEEREYLMHVIEEGKRAERQIREWEKNRSEEERRLAREEYRRVFGLGEDRRD